MPSTNKSSNTFIGRFNEYISLNLIVFNLKCLNRMNRSLYLSFLENSCYDDRWPPIQPIWTISFLSINQSNVFIIRSYHLFVLFDDAHWYRPFYQHFLGESSEFRHFPKIHSSSYETKTIIRSFSASKLNSCRNFYLELENIHQSNRIQGSRFYVLYITNWNVIARIHDAQWTCSQQVSHYFLSTMSH